ncbi:MAG: Ig-like domain-containing protein [Oscillospiraceae bacterium]|nr:Ig-like domain-containing protein [Oscillospiraceae bacterium]
MKKTVSVLLALMFVLGMLVVTPVSVSAKNANDSDVFLKQQTDYTCTLSSAAMLLRRRAIIDGKSNWSSITESSISSAAWINNAGLKGNFWYDDMHVVQVTMDCAYGQEINWLQGYLNSHPEGVVVYNSYNVPNQPHAVLVTSISNGTVYCADPWYGVAGGIIPIANSALVGSGQAGKLYNLSSIWYISNKSGGSVNPTPDPPPTPPGVGSRSVSGDFNGDGKDDYATLFDMGKGRSAWHVFLSTGTSFSEEVWWQETTENWYPASGVSGRVVAGDFNGDGKDDIAAMFDYGNAETKIHVWLSTGTNFKGVATWRHWTPGNYDAKRVADRVVAGDFNGDGKDDIASIYYYDWDGLNEIRTHVLLSTGTGFSSEKTWVTNTQYNGNLIYGRVVAGDFNGDGKDDIAAMYDYGNGTIILHTWTSTGTKFNGWYNWREETGGYHANQVTGRIVAGDFNGDGKDDVAAMYDYGEGTAKMHIFMSTGSAFQPWFQNTWWECMTKGWFYANAVTGRMVAGDFNGDGKDDIATLYDYDNQKARFDLFLSTGSSWTERWWNELVGYNAKRTTGITGFTDNYTAGFSFKHAHTYKTAVTAPTCTAQGYTTYSCTKGDHSYTANTTAAKGHNYGAWVVTIKATETLAGAEIRTCQNNGTHLETRSIPKLPMLATTLTLNSTAAATLGVGQTTTRTATITPANVTDKTIAWTSSNTAVATVSGGKVTAVAAGTATITAQTSNDKTASFKVTIKPAPTKIAYKTTTATIGAGQTYATGVTLTPSNAQTTRTYTSSNTKVATVDANGKITGKAAGTATITVKTYNGKTATFKVTVKPAPTKIALNKSVTLGVGEKYQTSVAITPSNAQTTRTYSSSNTKVATVDNTGKITAKAVGTAKITVKTYNGKTSTITVTVKAAPSKVTLSRTKATLYKGESLTLAASLPSGTASLVKTWTSSNTKVATVSSGKITAKGKGSATVTVKLYNGKMAVCKVTVK